MEQLRAQISSEDKALMDESFALADRIHFLLKKHGITQRQLAEKLGKRESEISKWLSGGHNFTSQTLIKIGLAIGERIYHIPNTSVDVQQAKMYDGLLATSFVRLLYRQHKLMAHNLKYQNFVSPEISELEVNSVGVICARSKQADNSFIKANIKPEDFKNIERVKVS